MSLRRAFSLGAVQTLSSMVLSFISIKVTSVYLGPAGIATLGQLNYFMSLTQGAVGSGLQVGLIRRIAQLGDDSTQKAKVVSTVLRVMLALGIPGALIIALGSDWLASTLLHDVQLRPALLIYAGVFVFSLLVIVIVGCAMGAQDYRTSTTINIGTGVVSLILVVLLCPLFGVFGGLLSLAILPLGTLLIAWLVARKKSWWPRGALSHGYSAPEGRSALAYVPMQVINTVGMPMLQLLIRDGVASHSGIASVGLLQGVMRLSDMYMSIVSSVFVMYFFPRFSSLSNVKDLIRETRRGLMIIVPAVGAVSLSIYLLRDLIISLIFTRDFLPMRELFGWQMLGNTFNMTGVLFAYLLLSKIHAFAMATLATATMLVWWLFSLYFISLHGSVGATEAYAVTYGLYMVATGTVTFFMFRRMQARQAEDA